jgi:hypothetical protein
MKRSTKVALSLLVPAITAYGCSNNPTTVQAPASGAISNVQGSNTNLMNCSCGHSFTVSRDSVARTVQCPKCDRTLTVSQYNYPYRSSSGFFGWFGGSRSDRSTGISNRNVSYGGFGSTGVRFFGGS